LEVVAMKTTLMSIALGSLLTACIVMPAEGAFVLDLADIVGGGNGTLPGTGGSGGIAAPVAFASSALSVVDGTFMPNVNSATPATISSTGLTFDFSAETSYSTPYDAFYNGSTGIDNPSSQAGLPNFAGDANFHSLLSSHATKGITFDLNDVRAAGKSANLFTAYIGDSRLKPGGSVSYYVVVDGVLKANRNDITNSEDFVAVPLSATDRFLTLVMTDARIADINSDHGYFGDAFLRSNAFVWDGGGSPNVAWSSGNNWVGDSAPTSGSSTEIVIAGDVNVGTSASPLNQDAATPFVLNRVQVTGRNVDGTATTADVFLGGNALQFESDGTFAPELAVNRNQTVTISSNLVAANDLTLTVLDGSAANDLVIGGQLSGSGALTKQGSGTVVFNGANGGFSGNVVVNAGTLILDKTNNPPLGANSSRTVTINAGATLTATAGGQNPFGTGTQPPLIIVNGGTMNTADSQHTTNLELTGGTIQPTSAGTQVDGLDMQGSPSLVTTRASANQSTIAAKMTVRNAVTFDVAEGAAATDLLMSGQMVGAGSLRKTGAGTMVLTAVNSVNGGVTVDGGILRLQSASQSNTFPNGSTITVNSGAAVEINNTNQITGVNWAINGGTWRMTGGVHEHVGPVTLNGGTMETASTAGNDQGGNYILDSNIVVGGSAASYIRAKDGVQLGSASRNFNVADAVAGAGADLIIEAGLRDYNNTSYGLVKDGAGTLVLAGTNVFTGTIRVNVGTVSVSDDANVGAGGVALNTGTLQIAGSTLFSTAKPINLLAGSTIEVANTAGAELTGVNTLRGGGELIKTGAGTLAINSTGNTFTGWVRVNSGTIRLGSEALIKGASYLHNNWGGGGTYDINGNNESVVALGGNPTLTNSSATPATFTVTNGGGWDYGGQITGNLAIRKMGANWERFTRNNTYTGGTTVDGGILYLRGANNGLSTVGTGTLTINAGGTLTCESHNVLGSVNDANIPAVVINGGTLTPAQNLHVKTIDMTGGTIALGTSNDGAGLDWQHGANTLATHAAAGSAAVAAKMTLSRLLTVSVEDGEAADDLVVSGTMVGPDGFTKLGDGRMVVSGTNTYAGATTLSAGTLQMDGSLTGTGGDVIVAGGMLSGAGSIARKVSVDALGAISAGDSPGKLTIDGDYVQSGTMLVEIAGTGQGTTYDWIAVTGAGRATLNPGATIDIELLGGFQPQSGDAFDILTAAGGITNLDLSGINFQSSGAGLTTAALYWTPSIADLGDGVEAIRLTVSAPEPSALALLSFGILGLTGCVWRRRRG
jgi:autotransporter-associated beta strand protein